MADFAKRSEVTISTMVRVAQDLAENTSEYEV